MRPLDKYLDETSKKQVMKRGRAREMCKTTLDDPKRISNSVFDKNLVVKGGGAGLLSNEVSV